MKKILFASLAVLPLVSCGSGSDQVSDVSSTARMTRQETSLVEGTLEVTPVNGGFNPEAFAIKISGQVLLGGNPCAARGVTAALETARLGSKIVVTPIRMVPREAETRICTMEYNPVYAEASTVVRGFRQSVSDVVVKNVGAMGTEVSAFAVNDVRTRDTVVKDVKATVANGGINPSAFAYDLKGTVSLGSNPCTANGVTAKFVEKMVGNTMTVVATLSLPAGSEARMCTREFNPVFISISTRVRGLSTQVSKVIVKNVDEMGNDIAIQNFLSR